MKLSVVQIHSEIQHMEALTYREMEQDCLLKEWGKWGRMNNERLGYPKMPAFSAKGWGEPDLEEVIPDIPDDTGVRIDKLISTLPKIHNQIIKAIYLYRVPWLKLPLLMRMSRSKVEAYQFQAIGIIWSKL